MISDVNPWRDEFTRVSKRAGQLPPDVTYRSFINDLEVLKAEGFADWLITACCGPVPEEKRGHFHYGERPGENGMQFADAFRSASEYFGENIANIARDGVRKTLIHFDVRTGTAYGLYTLLECTAALGMRTDYDKLRQMTLDGPI